MNQAGNVKKNIVLQTLYQVLNTCLPLITAPYLARVLGTDQLGVFSYTTANVSYFSLLAMLGIVNYGTRVIAANKNNIELRSQIIGEVFCIQLISSLFSIVLYVSYYFAFASANKTIVLIQGLEVLSCIFNIAWIFFGFEDFGITIKRSIVIRIITVVLIILLVHNPSDLWIYCLLMQGGTFLSRVYLWFFVRKRVGKRIELKWNPAHIKPILALFIPLLAMSIYHLMDKTMLGMLSSDAQSGYYYNSDKIINIPIGILTGFGTVLLPRITALVSEGKKEEADKLFLKSIEMIMFSSVAVAVGIASIAEEFVPVFFGGGYDECVNLIKYLAPVLIIKGLSLIIRSEYLVPRNKDLSYIKSVVSGALVNLVINVLLIPRYGALGAAVGTLVAEITACMWQYLDIRKELNCFPQIAKGLAYVIISLIMFIGVRIISRITREFGTIIQLVIEIIIGAILYIVICYIYWKVSKNDMMEYIRRK